MLEIDGRLKVLILRTLGLSQEDVAGVVHCAKQSVVEAERWFRDSPCGELSALLDDQRIRRLVGRDFPGMELASADLIRAGQMTADDILLHYGRTDARRAHSTVDPVYARRLEEHWAKLRQVATSLREQLSPPPARVLFSAEVCQLVHAAAACGAPLTQGERWRQVFNAPVEIRATAGAERAIEARLLVQDEFLYPQLVSHLQAESAGFAELDSWRKRLAQLLGGCLDQAREVTVGCSSAAGLPYIGAGMPDWLSYQFPAYVCQYATENPGCAIAPELLTEVQSDGSWRLTPRDFPAVTLAGGTGDHAEACLQAFAHEIGRNAGVTVWRDIATERAALEADAVALRRMLTTVIERGDFRGTCALCEGYFSSSRNS